MSHHQQQHVLPNAVWLTADSHRGLSSDSTWSAWRKMQATTNSQVRFTAGNKSYALSSSRFGEFDSTKKVTSDLQLFKKYRQVDVFVVVPPPNSHIPSLFFCFATMAGWLAGWLAS